MIAGFRSAACRHHYVLSMLIFCYYFGLLDAIHNYKNLLCNIYYTRQLVSLLVEVTQLSSYGLELAQRHSTAVIETCLGDAQPKVSATNCALEINGRVFCSV